MAAPRIADVIKHSAGKVRDGQPDYSREITGLPTEIPAGTSAGVCQFFDQREWMCVLAATAPFGVNCGDPADQGSITSMPLASKFRTLRVASVPLRAATMPAI
jgi:hypothetical protein